MIWLGVEGWLCSAPCSGAVVAGEETGQEVEQGSSRHPESLEEEEGEFKRNRWSSSFC